MTAPTGNKLNVAIRDAVAADMEAVRSIYNYYVETSTATFDWEPQSEEQRADWFLQHRRDDLPVIVAEADGRVIGWGSHSNYAERCGYKTTIEPSIYVHHEFIGKGVGRALMEHLITLAGDRQYHVLVGKICSENETSIRLCESFGFERIGELREVGRKFDRWLNVVLVQKLIK